MEKIAAASGKKMPFFDQDALKAWFSQEKRDFPWRKMPTPYAVWISEVMLQQTQAAVVVPYFERWMARFPTVAALAKSSLDDVIKMWEGLGYYSRARHLHQAAQDLVLNHSGELPRTREGLESIKGIGPYTRGAILSFAFHERAAAVDGNVLRVLSRYFAIEDEIEKAKKRVVELAESILPEKEPWVVMEGLIELGAQICRKKPLCEECPLKQSCLAHLHRVTHLLPKKRVREKITALKRAVALISCGNKLLVGRVHGKKVMAGLYEFPYVEFAETAQELPSLRKKIKHELKIEAQFSKRLPETEHSFTRYRATLYPSHWQACAERPVENYQWVGYHELRSLPFSSGHKCIIKGLNENLTH